MTQPTLDSLELHLELFGWEVVDVCEDLGSLPGTRGVARIAAMWEIASRWSPPDARMCILFVASGGRVTALEAAVVVGQRTLVRLKDPEVLRVDAGLDDTALEAFAANLGRYRGQPTQPRADHRHTA